MKHKFIPLILASMAIGALAACGPQTPAEPPMPNEYSLLEHWSVNGEEEYYEISETTNPLTITYTDVNSYRFVKRSFAFDSAKIDKFNVYKKLTFTGKLEPDATTGSHKALLKFEATGVNTEIWFDFSGNEATYELSLKSFDWTKLSSGMMMFFVNAGGTAQESGKMTFTKIALSQSEVDPQHNDLTPQEYNEYTSGDSFQVMTDWRRNGPSTEGIVVNKQTEGYKITWGLKGSEYANARALVRNGQGGNLAQAGFKRASFTLTGQSGRNAILKLETHGADGNYVGGSEVNVAFKGEEETVDVNAEALLAGEYAELWVLVMPDAGSRGSEANPGEILLKNVVLDKTAPADYNPPYANFASFPGVYLEKTKYSFTDIQLENHVQTIEMKNLAADWGNNIQYIVRKSPDISWADDEYTVFHAVVKSTVALTILVKAFDNGGAQKTVELAANEETVVEYVYDKTIVNFNNPFVIFINIPGENTPAATGTITFKYMQLGRANTNFYDGGDYVRVNTVRKEYDVFTCSQDANKDLVVSFENKKCSYDNIEFQLTGSEKGWNHVSVNIKSTVATKMLLKLMGRNETEKRIDLVIGDNELDFTFPGSIPTNAMFGNMHLFIGLPEDGATEETKISGQVTFVNFRVSAVPANA